MKIALLASDGREVTRKYDQGQLGFGTAPEALLQGFVGMSDVEVHVISCAQQPMSSPEKWAKNIFFHGLLVPKIGWMRTGYQGCIRAVRRKLREIRPDIVHGQGTERECAISAVLSGYPNVLTIHGNMAALARQFKAPLGSYLWLAGLLENLTLPRTGGVFCNSAYTESLVRPRNRRTWRVANPLRETFFEPIPERASGDRPRLINVGMISPRKRQVELLAMFKRLHEQGLPFQIEFIGDIDKSPYGEKFLRAVREATEAGYGRFSGSKDIKELIAAYDRMDGCVHFPTEEAFGLVVAESLARNLKFFGAREGGIIDIAASVDGAELFAPNDWAGLEEGLRQWLRAAWPRPKKAALKMAECYYPRVIAARHMEIYREVLFPSHD